MFKFYSTGEGGGGGDWKAGLPESIRNDPSLASFKDVGALAESFIKTKSLVGASIRPPGPGATKEAKQEFVTKLVEIEPALMYVPDNDADAEARLLKRLGKPEKPEEYEFEPEVKDAGLNEDELRALAVHGGLTKKQMKNLSGVMAKATLEQRRLLALEKASLDAEWGETKEERTLAARAAAMKMGLTEAEANSLTPRGLKAYYNVSRAVGVKGNELRPPGNDGGIDPHEAQRQMDEIRANPDYFDAYKNPAAHRNLVERMKVLSAKAHPKR